MLKILFPATNRVHLARQKFLLMELKKFFEVTVVEYSSVGEKMSDIAIEVAKFFDSKIKEIKPDILLARGDRFELLPIVVSAAYSRISIVHIEAGDLSGAIDNKVRHAITQLADVHFATNKESFARLISMGTDPDKTFNFGSLDVEYAMQAKLGNPVDGNYVVVAFHPIPGEDGKAVSSAVHSYFKDVKIIEIGSNKDYGMVYPGETYEADDYISLLAYADCLIGNSSSFLKEASIFSTPVVLVGDRQKSRLMPKGIVCCEHDEQSIVSAIKIALEGRKGASCLYSKPFTSQNIAKKLNFIFKSV